MSDLNNTELLYGQRLLDALADSTRRSIFNLLLKKPQPVKLLCAELPVSQPAVSQHLKIMREAGLVTKTQQGRYHLYEVNPNTLDWLSQQFGALRDDVLQGIDENGVSLPLADTGDPVDSVIAQLSATLASDDLLPMSLVLRLFMVVHQIKSLTKRACAPYGISLAERHLLNILDRLQLREATLAQLASGSLLPLTTTAYHLNRLEQLGLVALSVRDCEKALNLITMTPTGLEILNTIRQDEKKNEFAALYKTPISDLKQLEKLLRPLVYGLQETLNKTD